MIFILIFIFTFIFLLNSQLFIISNQLHAAEVDWQKLKIENRNMLKSDPDNILVNFRLVVALANLGKVKEAYILIEGMKEKVSIEKFKEEVDSYIDSLNKKNEKNNLLILNYSAFSEMIRNDYENAAVNFKRIKKIDPENVWIRNYLAASYVELNQYELAETELEKALAIKENEYSRLILGVIYYNQGNYLKALQEFSRSGDLFEIILEMF